MFHDRVSFDGTLIAIGTLYVWLMQFPCGAGRDGRGGRSWVSGVTGFASFLCYLDTWHGASTLGLLPLCLGSLWKTRQFLPNRREGGRSLFVPGAPLAWRTRPGLGRCCLLAAGLGMAGAGAVIMLVGMTVVFVPGDLGYLGIRAAQLNANNARLVPLIAHDRAGFGGGLLSCGLTVFLVVWKARITPDL